MTLSFCSLFWKVLTAKLSQYIWKTFGLSSCSIRWIFIAVTLFECKHELWWLVCRILLKLDLWLICQSFEPKWLQFYLSCSRFLQYYLERELFWLNVYYSLESIPYSGQIFFKLFFFWRWVHLFGQQKVPKQYSLIQSPCFF